MKHDFLSFNVKLTYIAQSFTLHRHPVFSAPLDGVQLQTVSSPAVGRGFLYIHLSVDNGLCVPFPGTGRGHFLRSGADPGNVEQDLASS